eukprot:g27229.t1
MVDMRSGPATDKVRVGAMVLNKHVDHMKAANLQTVQEQIVPGSSTAFLAEVVDLLAELAFLVQTFRHHARGEGCSNCDEVRQVKLIEYELPDWTRLIAPIREPWLTVVPVLDWVDK